MGTKIIEQGSTAGGIAKVEYLDESGNVLYEVNDSDKIFKMVNGKISGLAGTGNRMVTADASGNLSAGEQIETGTWTPVLKGSTSGIAVAGAGNTGRYTKIGKLVMFTACVDWTSITGTITGSRIITGLPYNCSSTLRGSATIGTSAPGSIICNTNRSIGMDVELSQTFMYVAETDLQNGGAHLNTVTIGSSGALYSITGHYYTD